jgi:hypothetical protein
MLCIHYWTYNSFLIHSMRGPYAVRGEVLGVRCEVVYFFEMIFSCITSPRVWIIILTPHTSPLTPHPLLLTFL